MKIPFPPFEIPIQQTLLYSKTRIEKSGPAERFPNHSINDLEILTKLSEDRNQISKANYYDLLICLVKK